MHRLTEILRVSRAGTRAVAIIATVLVIGAMVPQTAQARGGWHWHGGRWWWGPGIVGGLALGAALTYPYYYGYPYSYPYAYPYPYPYPPPAYYPPPAPGAAAGYPPPPAGAAPAAEAPAAGVPATPYAGAPAAPAAGAPGAPQGAAAITYTSRPAFRNAAGETCREYTAGGVLGTACQDAGGQWRVAN